MPRSQQKHSSHYQAKRHRGQNFLVDKNILAKIVETAGIKPSETILEVGPGMGALTEELVKRAKAVIAVEIDKDLFSHLSERFIDCKNLSLIKDDILNIDISSLLHDVSSFKFQVSRYSIVANLPYNITSRFFRKFLEAEPQPERMTVLVQKEVASRMTARPPDMNLLALSVQLFCDVKVAFGVSRSCFRPKPKVESAVVNLLIHPERAERVEWVLRLAKTAFSQKRKQCAQTIGKKLDIPLATIRDAFQKADIGSRARAEEISLKQWLALAEHVGF